MAAKNDLKLVVTDYSISLFGEKFSKSGKNWIVPTDLGIPAEINPGKNSLANIEKCIKDDERDGKLDKIDHIRNNPQEIGLAYLEGIIPKKTFEDAKEEKEYIQITLEIFGKSYPVRIYPEDAEMPEGTYTKEGEIV